MCVILEVNLTSYLLSKRILAYVCSGFQQSEVSSTSSGIYPPTHSETWAAVYATTFDADVRRCEYVYNEI